MLLTPAGIDALLESVNEAAAVSAPRTGGAAGVGADQIEFARRLVPVLKALADMNRLAIVLELAQRERSVTELTEIFGLSQTLVSHHLKVLRDCRLVTVTAIGRSNVYAICCDELAEPIRLLTSVVAPTSAP